MIEQAGLSIAISEGAGLRIADCPETFSPAVNLALIFIISFSTHFAGEMQGLRTVHISGVKLVLPLGLPQAWQQARMLWHKICPFLLARVCV
jgi:hypothetical protein